MEVLTVSQWVMFGISIVIDPGLTLRESPTAHGLIFSSALVKRTPR